jgi:outer membrane autotransporter protein
VVKPEIRASWQHEFGDRDYSIVSRFANGAGNSFTVTGPEIGRDSLLIGAGAAVLLNERVSIYAYYDGELARTNYSSHNVSAGLRVTF